MNRTRYLSPVTELDRRAKRQEQLAYAVGVTAALIFVLLVLGAVTDQIGYFLNLDDSGWVIR